MTTLVTMARVRVPQDLQRHLAQLDAVVYAPLLKLVPVAFDPAPLIAARQLVVTSDQGLHYLLVDQRLRTTPLVCLSRRLARRAAAAGFQTVTVAAQPTRQATFAACQAAVWVTGDQSPTPPANITRLVAYRAVLDEGFAQVWPGQDWRRALVTSPSNWRALAPWVVGTKLEYFALGEATAQAIEAAGFACRFPRGQQAVLAAAVALMVP